MAVKVEPKPEPIEASLPPPPKKPAPPKPDAKEKAAAIKVLTDFRRASAWSLHRWPLSKRVLDERSKVYLPRGYLGKDGIEVKVVRAGQDLNQFIYRHYYEEVSENTTSPVTEVKGKGKKNVREEAPIVVRKADNYVSGDNLQARRHEFLGPDPRIAGYHFDIDGDIHIKFWDSFLKIQWMDRQKWEFDVILDDTGKWVEKET